MKYAVKTNELMILNMMKNSSFPLLFQLKKKILLSRSSIVGWNELMEVKKVPVMLKSIGWYL